MLREVANLDELRAFAGEVAGELHAGRQLILLDGPMGAGKTQFSRYLLEAMGSSEVSSPSFAIHNRYETSRGTVDHVDLYRIDNKDDLESTGFWDLFQESDATVIVEWSDRLKDWDVFSFLPRSWPLFKLRFEIPPREENATGTKRHILVQKTGGGRK